MKYDITDAELNIMQILWSKNQQSSKSIHACLDKDWNIKTTNTLLNRLVKKGTLRFEKQGREYIYFVNVSKSDYTASKSEHFLQRLFNGKLSPFVAHFASYRKLSDDDIRELKKLINDWERRDD
ncbi:BlaI/MecI/CopY family transcriptional regulator [Glaciecola sp. XM2]|jgi:predicted transcriptional regulator|uniref:BlaI/MecI/CopY family transcriptional regulator n=1 Tax=Glaciecola sp. XM2 TaxID=1914931 RepID=UPI001BDE3F27|nr:BlaI/MecI/CopY family transcriptional regulator [Glaciecola sp. XM2]MBT1451208.1 BlaI/MecI/CopY family transcriptional regulator [Glaciecola sp. XM2]